MKIYHVGHLQKEDISMNIFHLHKKDLRHFVRGLSPNIKHELSMNSSKQGFASGILIYLAEKNVSHEINNLPMLTKKLF